MKSFKIAEKLYLGKINFKTEFIDKFRLKYNKQFTDSGDVLELSDSYKGTGYLILLSKRYDSDFEVEDVPKKVMYKIIRWLYDNNYNTCMYNFINFMKDKELLTMYSTPGKHALLGKLISERINSNNLQIETSREKVDKKYLFDFLEELESNHYKVKLLDYNRVSQKSDLALSDTDKMKILDAMESGSKTNISKVVEQINEDQVRMTYKSELMPFIELSYNMNRANVSFLTIRDVTLTNIPKNEWDVKKIDSKISRQYTLIINGQLNVKNIEVYIDDPRKSDQFSNEYDEYILQRSAYIADGVNYNVFKIDLDKFPFIKSGKIKPVTYTEMAELLYRIEQLRYQIWEYKKKTEVNNLVNDPRYVFLKSIGVKGEFYTPKVTKIDSNKVIEVTEFITKLTKSSTNPERSKVLDKIKSGKELTPKERLVRDTKELTSDEGFKMAENNLRSLLRSVSETKVKLMLTSQELVNDDLTEYKGMNFICEYNTIQVNI